MAKRKSKITNSKRMDSGFSTRAVVDGDTEEFQNSAFFETQNDFFENGLGEALLGGGYGQFNPFGLPAPPGGFPGTETVSNVQSLFKNLRWYLVSNYRQLLSEIFVELGFIQTMICLPVDDALRGGVKIKSSQLDEDEIKKLSISVDRDGDLTTVGLAAYWNRLFGGSAVIVLTDQDPEMPLDLDALGPDDALDFRAVDMWELFWSSQNTEGFDPSIQENDFEHYDYYGEKLHKSRVMRMKGLEAPSFIRPRLRGWGFSIVEIMVRSINQYLKSVDLTYQVLDEFKVDVYKFDQLIATLLQPSGEEKVRKRVAIANATKNYTNAVVLDKNDDFDHKQISFAGLGECQTGVRRQLAADLRMPVTKLFGASESGGLGTANQDDLENYNAMVEGTVRDKIKYIILRLLEIKCQKLFGFVPDDLEIEFHPLRMLSAVDEETVKTQKSQRIIAWQEKGLLTAFECREAANKGNLFDISLDNAGDELNPDDPEIDDLVTEGVQDPKNPADYRDPGTGRRDVARAKLEPNLSSGKGEYGGRPGEASPDDRQTLSTRKKTAPSTKQNKIRIRLIPAYTGLERVIRTIVNSAEFDRKSYEADGGDAWIDPRRKPLFENPGMVDEALWEKAKQASQAAFGRVKWQFVTWWYKKQGGSFHKAA